MLSFPDWDIFHTHAFAVETQRDRDGAFEFVCDLVEVPHHVLVSTHRGTYGQYWNMRTYWNPVNAFRLISFLAWKLERNGLLDLEDREVLLCYLYLPKIEVISLGGVEKVSRFLQAYSRMVRGK